MSFGSRWAKAVASASVFYCVTARASGTYQAAQVGLVGPDYTWYVDSNGKANQNTSTFGFNANGQAAGVTGRYNASGTALGADAWVFDGRVSRQLGFIGDGYSYVSTGPGGGTYRASVASALNASGEVVGFSTRFDASGGYVTTDSWLYDGTSTQKIGLVGGSLGVLYAQSYATGIDTAGNGFGYTYRQDTAHNDLGQDVWVTSQGVTRQIGLNVGVGPQPAYQYEEVRNVNAAGYAVGIRTRYSTTGVNIGQDAWYYKPGTTYQIGFTGSGYAAPRAGGEVFQYSDVTQVNGAGTAIGSSLRYNSAGTFVGADAWVSNGQSTAAIGLTGPGYSYTMADNGGGIYHDSRPTAINHNVKVIGQAVPYNAAGQRLGTDPWIFDGTVTRRLGLFDATHSFASTTAGGDLYREGYAFRINDPGQSAGVSYCYNAVGTMLGQDAWFDDGTTSRQVGLTGPGYTRASADAGGGTIQINWTSRLNNAGQLTGYTNRFDNTGKDLGYAGWFYDSATNTTTPLSFGLRASDNYSYTQPVTLTSTGDVVGIYETFPGDVPTNHWFSWSLSKGFADLTTLYGLSDVSIQDLAQLDDFSVPANRGILSDGPLLFSGQSGTHSAFLLSASPVPEPTLLAPLATGLLLLRRRRQRRSIVSATVRYS